MKRIISMILVVAIIVGSCTFMPQTSVIVQASSIQNLISNGDFEQESSDGFTVSGDNNWSEYGYKVTKDSYSALPNNYFLNIWNDETVERTYTISQSVSVTAGGYYASVDTSGSQQSGMIEAKLSAGIAEVSIYANGWDQWDTYNTDHFVVTSPTTITVTVEAKLTGSDAGADPYLNIDNIQLFKVSVDEEEDTSLIIDDTAVDAGVYVKKIEGLADDFIMGADVSSLLSLEESGIKFYDWDGVTEKDMLETMAESGVNWVRIRIWNDPYTENGDGYGAGNTDLEKAIILAKRAQDAGLKILLNFHYSDFWAHPGVQTVPKAWSEFTVDERAEAIYSYTTDSLNAMKEAGVTAIGMVQVGNETTTKFCGSSDWAEMAKMFNAGCSAVKDFDSSIKTAIHFTNPERTSVMKELADQLNIQKVNYDVFATSYYPFWHGTLDNLENILNYVADTYDKEVMVAEVSWVWTLEDGDGHENNVLSPESVKDYGASVQGQATVMREVMNSVASINNNKGIGTFYWEPAWLPVTDDSATGGLSTTEKWNQLGTGWASIYAQEYPGYDAYDDVADYWGGSSWENHSLFDWNSSDIAKIDVSKPGKYVVNGTLSGIDTVTAQCTVEIYNDTIVNIDNITATVKINETITYPSTIEATYYSGAVKTVDITWNEAEVKKVTTKKAGGYVVSGTVEGWDEVVYIYITVQTENLVANSSFENTNNQWGAIREVPNWTLLSSVGTSATKPIYVNTNEGGKDGNSKLAVWTDQFDSFDVDAYQEIDITGSGDGEYTVSFAGMGNGQNAVVYIQNGTYGSSVVKEVAVPASDDWKMVSFKINIENTDTITIGFKASDVKSNEWINVDTMSVVLTSANVQNSTLQELVDSTENYSSVTCNTSDASWTAYQSAKAAAESVLKDSSATESTVKQAYETLNNAINSLQFKITVNQPFYMN